MPTDPVREGPGEIPSSQSGSDPFDTKGNSVETEARKTMDSTWDSPFHSLGRGSTQAAPGNHKHLYKDLEELPGADVLDQRYVNIPGDEMTGQLSIKSGNLRFSSTTPGEYQGIHFDQNGRYLYVLGNRYYMADENGSLSGPTQIGAPVDGNSAINVAWGNATYAPIGHVHPLAPDFPMHLSGPHGPVSGYETIQVIAGGGDATIFSVALNATCPVAGLGRLTVGGYMNIQGINGYSQNSLSAYTYPYMRWHDGGDGGPMWTNGVDAVRGRLTLIKGGPDSAYVPFLVMGTFVCRPGKRASFGCSANVDKAYDGGVVAQFGHIRVTVEYYENAGVANDSPAWGGT